MKKLLLIILLLFSWFGYSQINPTLQNYYVPNPATVQTINVTNPNLIVSNGWAVIGNSCAGCPSYYWKITRTISPILAENGNGYYYYYLFFYSNSYHSNGQTASTYLTNISVYADGIKMVSLNYALVVRQERYYAWIRSVSPNKYIQFNTEYMKVY